MAENYYFYYSALPPPSYLTPAADIANMDKRVISVPNSPDFLFIPSSTEALNSSVFFVKITKPVNSGSPATYSLIQIDALNQGWPASADRKHITYWRESESLIYLYVTTFSATSTRNNEIYLYKIDITDLENIPAPIVIGSTGDDSNGVTNNLLAYQYKKSTCRKLADGRRALFTVRGTLSTSSSAQLLVEEDPIGNPDVYTSYKGNSYSSLHFYTNSYSQNYNCGWCSIDPTLTNIAASTGAADSAFWFEANPSNPSNIGYRDGRGAQIVNGSIISYMDDYLNPDINYMINGGAGTVAPDYVGSFTIAESRGNQLLTPFILDLDSSSPELALSNWGLSSSYQYKAHFVPYACFVTGRLPLRIWTTFAVADTTTNTDRHILILHWIEGTNQFFYDRNTNNGIFSHGSYDGTPAGEISFTSLMHNFSEPKDNGDGTYDVMFSNYHTFPDPEVLILGFRFADPLSPTGDPDIYAPVTSTRSVVSSNIFIPLTQWDGLKTIKAVQTPNVYPISDTTEDTYHKRIRMPDDSYLLFDGDSVFEAPKVWGDYYQLVFADLYFDLPAILRTAQADSHYNFFYDHTTKKLHHVFQEIYSSRQTDFNSIFYTCWDFSNWPSFSIPSNNVVVGNTGVYANDSDIMTRPLVWVNSSGLVCIIAQNVYRTMGSNYARLQSLVETAVGSGTFNATINSSTATANTFMVGTLNAAVGTHCGHYFNHGDTYIITQSQTTTTAYTYYANGTSVGDEFTYTTHAFSGVMSNYYSKINNKHYMLRSDDFDLTSIRFQIFDDTSYSSPIVDQTVTVSSLTSYGINRLRMVAVCHDIRANKTADDFIAVCCGQNSSWGINENKVFVYEVTNNPDSLTLVYVTSILDFTGSTFNDPQANAEMFDEGNNNYSIEVETMQGSSESINSYRVYLPPPYVDITASITSPLSTTSATIDVAVAADITLNGSVTSPSSTTSATVEVKLLIIIACSTTALTITSDLSTKNYIDFVVKGDNWTTYDDYSCDTLQAISYCTFDLKDQAYSVVADRRYWDEQQGTAHYRRSVAMHNCGYMTLFGSPKSGGITGLADSWNPYVLDHYDFTQLNGGDWSINWWMEHAAQPYNNSYFRFGGSTLATAFFDIYRTAAQGTCSIKCGNTGMGHDEYVSFRMWSLVKRGRNLKLFINSILVVEATDYEAVFNDPFLYVDGEMNFARMGIYDYSLSASHIREMYYYGRQEVMPDNHMMGLLTSKQQRVSFLSYNEANLVGFNVIGSRMYCGPYRNAPQFGTGGDPQFTYTFSGDHFVEHFTGGNTGGKNGKEPYEYFKLQNWNSIDVQSSWNTNTGSVSRTSCLSIDSNLGTGDFTIMAIAYSQSWNSNWPITSGYDLFISSLDNYLEVRQIADASSRDSFEVFWNSVSQGTTGVVDVTNYETDILRVYRVQRSGTTWSFWINNTQYITWSDDGHFNNSLVDFWIGGRLNSAMQWLAFYDDLFTAAEITDLISMANYKGYEYWDLSSSAVTEWKNTHHKLRWVDPDSTTNSDFFCFVPRSDTVTTDSLQNVNPSGTPITRFVGTTSISNDLNTTQNYLQIGTSHNATSFGNVVQDVGSGTRGERWFYMAWLSDVTWPSAGTDTCLFDFRSNTLSDPIYDFVLSEDQTTPTYPYWDITRDDGTTATATAYPGPSATNYLPSWGSFYMVDNIYTTTDINVWWGGHPPAPEIDEATTSQDTFGNSQMRFNFNNGASSTAQASSLKYHLEFYIKWDTRFFETNPDSNFYNDGIYYTSYFYTPTTLFKKVYPGYIRCASPAKNSVLQITTYTCTTFELFVPTNTAALTITGQTAQPNLVPALLITGQTAEVNAESGVTKYGPATLTLTPNQSTVNVESIIDGITKALILTPNQAEVYHPVNLSTATTALVLSPQTATVYKTDLISAITTPLILSTYPNSINIINGTLTPYVDVEWLPLSLEQIQIPISWTATFTPSIDIEWTGENLDVYIPIVWESYGNYTPSIPIEWYHIDNVNWPATDPVDPIAAYTLSVTIDGIDYTSKISGQIKIDAEENSSIIASFAFILDSGSINDMAWMNKKVTIDVNGSRRYTGVVTNLDFDADTGVVLIKCSSDLQSKFEKMKTPSEVIEFLGVGSWNEYLFNQDVNGWQYANDIISTVPYSIWQNAYGMIKVSSWNSKVSPDLTITDSNRYPKSIKIDRASRRSLINTVYLEADYKYSNFKKGFKQITQKGPNSNEYWCLGVRGLQEEEFESAIDGLSGWQRIGEIDFRYNDIPFIDCFGVRNYLLDSGPPHTAIAQIGKKWVQDVTEKHIVTVQSSESANYSGKLVETLNFGVESEYRNDEWEKETGEGSDFSEAEFSSDIGVNSKGLRTDFDEASLVALNVAKTKILSSHRKNFVTVRIPFNKELNLSHTVRINTLRLDCKGKVVQLVDVLNTTTGEFYTDVTIAISLYGGQGLLSDDPIVAFEKPEISINTEMVTSHTFDYYVGGIDNVAYDPNWIGYITNTVQKQFTSTDENGDPFTYYNRNYDASKIHYPIELKIELPEEETDDIKSHELLSESSFEVLIPTDTLIMKSGV